MKVALIQMQNDHRKENNIEKAIGYIKQAASQQAKIVCLEELFSTLYFAALQDPKFFSIAAHVPGETILSLATIAKESKTTIIAPIFEADRKVPGNFYNTAVVLGEDGQTLGKYRKTHIPQAVGYQEKFYFKPGDLAYPVFEIRECKFGVVICYDRHFVEGPRCAALNGAQMVFVPTCTGAFPDIWELELRAHAVFNAMYVAGVNRCGTEFPEQPFPYYGRSLVVNPRGEVIARLRGEGLLVTDIDFKMVEERRMQAPFLRDRNPAMYGEIIKPA